MTLGATYVIIGNIGNTKLPNSKKKVRVPKVTVEDAKKFVEAWQGSNRVTDVVAKTGLSKEKVVATSRLLRKRGVPLKMYGKSTLPLSQLELDGLAELCK